MQATLDRLAKLTPSTRLKNLIESKDGRIDILTKALEDASKREQGLIGRIKELEKKISGLDTHSWSKDLREALDGVVEDKAGKPVEPGLQTTLPEVTFSDSRLDATPLQRYQAVKPEERSKPHDVRVPNTPERSEYKGQRLAGTKYIKVRVADAKGETKVLDFINYAEHKTLLREKDLELIKLRNATNSNKSLLETKNAEIERLTKQVDHAARDIERLAERAIVAEKTSNSRDEAVKVLCDLLSPLHRSFIEGLENGGPELVKLLPWRPLDLTDALDGVDEQDYSNLPRLITTLGAFHGGLVAFKENCDRKTSDLVSQRQCLQTDLENTKETLTAQIKNQKQEINNQKAQNSRQKQEMSKQTEEIASKNDIVKENEERLAKQAESLKKDEIRIKNLQQTLKALKEESAKGGSNEFFDEMVRGHENELRKLQNLLEKQLPFVNIGIPVRNRLLEKFRPLDDQNTELKQLGNLAAHTFNAYADAMLYEEGFPVAPRADKEHYHKLYGYSPEYVLAKRSPRLNDLLSWSANMKNIASSYMINYDMTTFNKTFDEVWLMRENDDFNLETFAETTKGKRLFETLEAENMKAWTARQEAHFREKDIIKQKRLGRKKTFSAQR